MGRIDKLAVDESTKEMLRKESDKTFETMVKVKNVVLKRKTYDDALQKVKKVVFETSLDADEREKVIKAITRFGIVCMYQGYYVCENKFLKSNWFSKLKNIFKVR